MNNLQPYEKHLADRLHQVPVPDKDEGWKEMRKLLDRDMPEGGGGWGGNRRWWWMGITVAIIIAGLWTSQQFNESSRPGSNPAVASSNQDPLNESTTAVTTADNDIDQNIEVASPTAEIKAASPKHKPSTEDRTALKHNSTPNIKSVDKRETNLQEQNLDNTPSVEVAFAKGKDDAVTGAANITQTNNQNQVNKGSSKKKKPSDPKGQQITMATPAGAIVVGGQQKQQHADVGEMVNSGSNTNGQIINDAQNTKVYKTPEENAFISSFIIPFNLLDQAFQNPEDKFTDIPLDLVPIKAEPGKTDKAFAKEMRKQSIKEDNRKMSRKSMRGIGLEKDHELTFAAGLSLPQSFAIGSQQSPSYGVNAKPGKASDYLPVPFFQYHVNNRLFLQTELQFQAPQLTDRLLISYSQHTIVPANGMLEKNVFIEKLYYFHIPLNVYFSPIRNFYIGSGIQFSSLLSGVATYQDNRYTNGSLENSYSRVQGFKDDSIAAKLAPSEWRYQLEGNYYFNRFTFGARYNQALKQFVNLQPSPTLPFTQGRNQSFLVYLRYNIWEERKKNVHSLASSW